MQCHTAFKNKSSNREASSHREPLGVLLYLIEVIMVDG